MRYFIGILLLVSCSFANGNHSKNKHDNEQSDHKKHDRIVIIREEPKVIVVREAPRVIVVEKQMQPQPPNPLSFLLFPWLLPVPPVTPLLLPTSVHVEIKKK